MRLISGLGWIYEIAKNASTLYTHGTNSTATAAQSSTLSPLSHTGTDHAAYCAVPARIRRSQGPVARRPRTAVGGSCPCSRTAPASPGPAVPATRARRPHPSRQCRQGHRDTQQTERGEHEPAAPGFSSAARQTHSAPTTTTTKALDSASSPTPQSGSRAPSSANTSHSHSAEEAPVTPQP